MKTIKVSEATGPALNWLVAKCEGIELRPHRGGWSYAAFSTNWAQGGPIIERERIQIRPLTGSRGQFWEAYAGLYGGSGDGETPLIAACRCFVASRLGKEVEVPEEL